MNCSVMPLKNYSEISYRVKCVAVESERVFGDIFVTHQTRNSVYRADGYHFPPIYKRRKCNLIQQILPGPNFLEMNSETLPFQRRASEGPPIGVTRSQLKPRSKSAGDRGSLAFSHQDRDVRGREETVKRPKVYPLPLKQPTKQRVMVTSLVDQLLLDIYGLSAGDRGRSESESTASSLRPRLHHEHLQKARLLLKSRGELHVLVVTLREHINHTGGLLVRQLRRKDYLIAKRDKQCDIITAHLQAHSAKRVEDTKMRFSLTPQPGESGYTQWLDAMKMVAQLQGGIPPEFRKRLWLTLAERHLEQRGVDWKQAEKVCFNEWSNPDDEELGIQIVKDLHRTGCSLFCGAAGRDNQAVLRRVLLGFARWNKSVGYCQGLNVLAALVLQVMDRAESSAVKVMIYLIEGVLPEGYFADNLRGLSVDMAVFRDLLRSRLPKLSKHLEALQCDAKDKATGVTPGSSYEPPLTNVFTMQWFLTLFCHCLPQEAVLRVWDLIFLEGDEILLRTALAIWEGLSDRIMTVTSADEFYSIMGVLTREMLEFTDTNNLIKNIVKMGSLHGVTGLREKHRYNITPWARKLSDDEDSDTEEDERLAVAAAMFSMAQRLKKDRLPSTMGALQAIAPGTDRERLALDISTLKQQYAKLRERQRQAHIILSAACARQSMVPPATSQAMNHLLVGKNALVSAKNRPLSLSSAATSPKTRPTPIHSPRAQSRKDKQGVTLHWKDTKKLKKAAQSIDTPETGITLMQSPPQETAVTLVTSPRCNSTTTLTTVTAGSSTADSDSDSTSTELCDEPDRLSDVDSEEPTSTSDCYIMAADNAGRSSPIEGTTTSSGTPVRLLQDEDSDVDSNLHKRIGEVPGVVTEKDEEDAVKETSGLVEISIAKITDQIRRLSAEDDNNSSTGRISIEREAQDEEQGVDTDAILMASSRVEDEELGFRGAVDYKVESGSTMRAHLNSLDDFHYLSFESNVTRVDDEKLSLERNRLPESREEIGDVDVDIDKIIKSDPVTSTSASTEKKTSEIFNDYVGKSLSSDYDEVSRELEITEKRFETSLDFRSDFSLYSKSEDRSKPMSTIEENDSIEKSPISTIPERTYYSKQYVIGHVPISPMNLDEKLSKVPHMSYGANDTPLITTDISTKVDDKTVKSSFEDEYRSISNKSFRDAKKSPKTPDSFKSFSSGDTMGPDSKPSSLSASPRTSIRSESRDLVFDKSGCSSISSESKTLILRSDSDVARDSPMSDTKKASFDKSNPSTPISADSLKNKSDASDPKLVISSSSDSCSPSKVKSSERSFSSDLQSPISANSIKYTTNYNKRGQENISDSPMDLSAATSPFYPIANPNQKTPSPYSVSKRRRSIDSLETSPEQRSSVSSKESAKISSYQTKLDPCLQVVEASEAETVSRNSDVYIRPQFTSSKDDISTASLTGRDSKENVPHIYGTTAHNLYKKPGQFEENPDEQFSDKDVLSQLPQERLDKHYLNFTYRHKDRSRLVERSSSSLERRFADLKSSASTDEFAATMVKKRSSDILEDIKHLEAKAFSDGSSDPGMLSKKTSYIWEDLKNLEARRQDTFSNSARSFSKRRLEIPDISVTSENRKSYVVHPKIHMDEGTESILKSVSSIKDNGDADDGRESKVGVWTKVKPRKNGNNGRRSSDRALKIIQENSAILHKILACQAKKRLPDLEEISKEITISPINEEISKIFSPILEKMGLNEHEINEELARINFKDFDNVTATSVSEFDAKINDELCKLSLIDDSEQMDPLDVDEIVSHEYLDTREALIDRKINEELSKLLANYEEESSPGLVNVEKGSSSQNVSDVEGLDLTSISTNVFSYQSSNDSIDARSDFGPTQDVTVAQEKYTQFAENVLSYTSPKYVQDLSPKSDIDIYRELEKLDKISSAQILPDESPNPSLKGSSPNPYITNPSPYSEISPTLRYTAKTVQYNTSPLKDSYDVYQTFDFKPNLPSRKLSTNPYTSYNAATYDYMESGISSNVYDSNMKSPMLAKESLEFRVRYDDQSPRQTNHDFSCKTERQQVMNLDKSVPYYTNGASKPVTPTRYAPTKNGKCPDMTTASSFLEYPIESSSENFRRKYELLSPKIYPDGSRLPEYDRHLCTLVEPQVQTEPDVGSYRAPRHRNYPAISPSRQFPSAINHYSAKLSPGSGDDSKRPVSHPEFPDKVNAFKHSTDASSTRGTSCYKKSSLSLGNIGHANKTADEELEDCQSPRTQFSPFPVSNMTRKPKEIGLKLGLYSPKGSGPKGPEGSQLKKS